MIVVADRESVAMIVGDRGLAGGVEVSGRLVEQHQRRACEEGARERDPVRLSA